MNIRDFFQNIQNLSANRLIGYSTAFLLISIIIVEIIFEIFLSGTNLGKDEIKAAILAFIFFPTAIFNGFVIAIRQEFPFMENKNILEGPSAFLIGSLIILGSLILLGIVISSLLSGGPTLNGNVS